MASVDLDRLCSRLSSMQVDQLYSLVDEKSLTIPQIRRMTVPVAVACIRKHIADIPDTQKRLVCVSGIYAWLMEKGVIGPWVLYRAGDAGGAAESTLWSRYFEVVKFTKGFAHSLRTTEERTHVCSLVPESQSPTAGHDLYSFCFWPAVACVAAFRPPEGYSHRQKAVLGRMLGDNPDAFQCGNYSDLDSAHQAAARFEPAGPSAQES
ncbi:hypothetical protein MTO96_037060 [Rhipicephalus appendiculatus]